MYFTVLYYTLSQGQIFELLDDSGTIAPIVLKAAKRAALISDLEREWGVGQKIASLAGPDGELPGFMKVLSQGGRGVAKPSRGRRRPS